MRRSGYPNYCTRSPTRFSFKRFLSPAFRPPVYMYQTRNEGLYPQTMVKTFFTCIRPKACASIVRKRFGRSKIAQYGSSLFKERRGLVRLGRKSPPPALNLQYAAYIASPELLDDAIAGLEGIGACVGTEPKDDFDFEFSFGY